MFALVDTNTNEQVARFATEEYARAGAATLSGEYHRPLTILLEGTRKPIARYVDGSEIAVTASIHLLFPRDRGR